MHDATGDDRPLTVGCRAWLRGSGRAFPPRLRRGTLQLDGSGLVWRSPHRWQPPIGLELSLVELLGRRGLHRHETLWVDRGCSVFVLQYLTVGVELAVAGEDAAMVHAALTGSHRGR